MNYNLSKGEDLFFNEINEIAQRNSLHSDDLKVLASLFSGKIGVMQEGNLSDINFTDEKELLFDLNSVPSYKKLSYCILHTTLNCKSDNLKDKILYVVDSYKTSKFKEYLNNKTNNTDTETNQKFNDEIEEAFDFSQNLISQEIYGEDEEGNQYTKSIEMDSINLLEDFDDEDLTVEGFRSSGCIESDFDTSSNQKFELNKSRTKTMVGKLEIDSDGNPIITCPYTGSKSVYQIDSNTYASFETDQPFKIIFNLADLKDNVNPLNHQ